MAARMSRDPVSGFDHSGARDVPIVVAVEGWLGHGQRQTPAHCGDLATGWIRARRGLDLAGWATGLTRREWIAAVRQHPGGLLALAQEEASAASLDPGDPERPRAGQVGVVAVPASRDRTRLVMAIHDSAGRWAVLRAGGGILRSRFFVPHACWMI